MEIQEWLVEHEIERLQKALSFVGDRVRGQEPAIELCLSVLLARGHILIEGPVGVGKTDLAKTLAQLCASPLSRIQMTADLLPSEIVGGVRPTKDGQLEFSAGPIFANFVLADELNRTSPKTQAALLEAMAEYQVSVEGQTRLLPKPFIVVATQNPLDSEGVFPLAESQLDRFMAFVQLSAPSAEEETQVYLKAAEAKSPTESLWSPDFLVKLQGLTEKVSVHRDLALWVTRVLRRSRELPGVRQGVFVRGGLQWIALAKATALLAGRSFVIPDDLKKVAIPALGHRLILARQDASTTLLVESLLQEVEMPR